jgi:hypothetical protein
MTTLVGQHVRFKMDNLGASERGALHRTTGDVYGSGDEGIVAFCHPNRILARVGWVYVEVSSKTRPWEKLYVGCLPRMFDLVVPTEVRR